MILRNRKAYLAALREELSRKCRSARPQNLSSRAPHRMYRASPSLLERSNSLVFSRTKARSTTTLSPRRRDAENDRSSITLT
jgi:hypothetical protein